MNVERAFSILIGVAVMIILTPEINNVLAQPDISLESQRYIEESFFNQIVGEVINNGAKLQSLSKRQYRSMMLLET